eukprot:CAMPEP_0172397874 /NCGR_PEP_ID=MMETSP1061-20121228/33395_1 /TAXON_ID=37318 /ORGANISM="Pseudo-nitzschia pungens, Strain cf. pungens" /LENGTH=197 /DNA_ID=CAMNT_0013130205 /DNA_START=208 /DNA_END=801 /DNA_ORIENTATION=-
MKKSVSFQSSALMYRTKHLNDYTEEEIRKTWYSPDELTGIILNCMETITAATSDVPSISSSQCLRGLEYRFPEGEKKRMANKFTAIDSVLDEQNIQWECEQNDVEKIRTRYSMRSIPCHEEASRIGLEDEKEAMVIYLESGCHLRTSSSNESKAAVEESRSVGMKLDQIRIALSPKTCLDGIPSIPLRQCLLTGPAA